MEPATKRRKKDGPLTDTEEDDELFLEPEELNQKRDPAFLLAQGRAAAAFQLKSRFEDIFAKYERDFTGIGDEIDLETGEVVVDNGHLSSMRSMKDWIVEDDEEGDEEVDEEGDAVGNQDEHRVQDEDEEVSREAEAQADAQAPPCGSDEHRPDLADGGPRDPWRVPEPNWPSGFASRGPPVLKSLIPTHSDFTIQDQSFPPFVHESSSTANPTWQAPELPPSAFLSNMSVSDARHHGGATPVVTRTVLRRSLKTPNSPEADDEDDLHTASFNTSGMEKQRESPNARVSPLLHKSFPAVDSSPNDNSLKDLIQDVIASMPDTPPSTRQSRHPKSKWKPSPLNQEHSSQQKNESNPRFTTTPLHFDGRGPPKKRGRKPKVRANPEETAQTTLGDQVDQSQWEESDLESFLDITNLGILKPAGQTLYVDIKEKKVKRQDMVNAEMVSDHHVNDIGFVTHRGVPIEMSAQHRKSSFTVDQEGQGSSIATKPRKSRQPDRPEAAEKFERNVVDPTFTFSDEEILLPRRSKKKQNLQSNHSDPSTLPSPPLVDVDLSQRMATEPNFTAVDGENITFAPHEAAARCRTKGREDKTADTDETKVLDQVQAAQSLPSQLDQIQKRPRGRPRAPLPRRPKCSTRDLNEQLVTEETRGTTEATIVHWKSKEPQVITPNANENNTRSKQQRRRSVRSSSNPDSGTKSGTNQLELPLSSTSSEENPPIHADRSMYIRQKDSSSSTHVNQEAAQLVAETGIGTSSDPELPIERSDLREDQKLPAAIPQRFSPSAPRSTHPTTPSKPRAKQIDKETPSFSTSVLSLLSDSDDDEDELSFNHSDFTPSGHHRILTHRPFPELPTTPRFSASSKKKKRTSLLHSRSLSSSSHKVSKPLGTPRSTGSRGGAGSASHRTSHRKSHQLARSVVRVVRRLDGHEEREGSVLQTPGGSKRRCGEDGWKCERDFCFVCME